MSKKGKKYFILPKREVAYSELGFLLSGEEDVVWIVKKPDNFYAEGG